jgi:transposase-like protein
LDPANMSTTLPHRCPFCESHDVREIGRPDADLSGYRCRECTQVFYLSAATTTPAAKAPAKRAARGTAKRKPRR